MAFAGRSNAGKSSAINALAQPPSPGLRQQDPGRTQQINFFSLGGGRFLVDLPGYGYAKVPGAMKRHWQELLSGYLQTRGQLRGLVVVMDVRHPLTPLDRQLLDWFAPTGRPVHVLLTKADKLSQQEATETIAQRGEESRSRRTTAVSVQLFSAMTKQGVDEAEALLAKWFDAALGSEADRLK